MQVFTAGKVPQGEIHEGLNVVENWNSANGFVFFGKGGEIATNRREDQEISVHALHLSSGIVGLCKYADDAIGAGGTEVGRSLGSRRLSRVEPADLQSC